MRVATTPDHLESVANHPRVFPYIARKGRERFDLSDVWADCIGFEWDEGGLVFHLHAPETYDVHILFLPKTRDTKGKANQAIGIMFNAGALELVAAIPADLPHCKRLALSVGFVPGESLGVIERKRGPVALHGFTLTRQAWANLPGVSNA